MKKIVLLIGLMVVPILNAQQITIDEDKSTISFNFEDDDVDGTLSGFEFSGSVDLGDLVGSSFSGSVTTETIDTNNWLRNRHLRRKYFKAKDFPKVSFNSNSISGTAESFTVQGELTIKGIKKSVTWNFTKNGTSLVGTTSVNTQDFDISIHKKYEENKATVTIKLPYK